MKQAAGILIAGITALDAGIDRVASLNDWSSAVHLACAISLAMLGAYVAQPVGRMLAKVFRRSPQP